MTRQQALHAYTAGSAWLSFEEGDRGHLRVGARADFAVLDADYLTIPTDEILAITSDLTVVGGRQVHASGAITASIADRRLPTEFLSRRVLYGLDSTSWTGRR